MICGDRVVVADHRQHRQPSEVFVLKFGVGKFHADHILEHIRRVISDTLSQPQPFSRILDLDGLGEQLAERPANRNTPRFPCLPGRLVLAQVDGCGWPFARDEQFVWD